MGVQVEKGAVVEWPEPVVVHLIGSDYPSGHFAIMLPKSTAKFARIWQANPGDAGSVVKVADLTPSMSGSVLLTSRSPISLSALKFKANQITLAEAALILPVLLVVLWILCDSVGRFNSRRLLPVAIHR